MEKNEFTKKIVAEIKRLGAVHSTWQVFEDFVALSAIAIQNAFLHDDKLERDYSAIQNRYSEEEFNAFPEMFANLTLALDQYAEYPQDVLGPIFHELELHNKKIVDWIGELLR